MKDTGMTILEVLVGCAVSILIVCLALTVLNRQRDEARAYVCADNLKQLGQLAQQYAADNRGKLFSQNLIYVSDVSGAKPVLSMWCDNEQLGQYTDQVEWQKWAFAKHKGQQLNEAINGIVRCPQAKDEEVRSYAQNHWANGLGLVKHKGWNFDPGSYPLGEHFDSGADKLDQLMLFVESNAILTSDSGWVTQFAGRYGRPSDRFTGGDGVDLTNPIPLSRSMPSLPLPRYLYDIPWVIDYSRHGNVNDPFIAEGETNVAFTDGHVTRITHDQLYDPTTRTSTYEALWSLSDKIYDKVEITYEAPSP